MAVYRIPRRRPPLPGESVSLNSGQPITKGLVACHPLRPLMGGIDLTGRHHGTLTGGPIIGGDPESGHLRLDGTDDYLPMAPASGLAFAAPGTVSAWISTTTETRTLFAVGESGAANNYYLVYIGDAITGTLTNELITVGRSVDGVITFIVGYTTATRTELFDGRPHLVTIVADGVSTKIYLDGRSRTVTTGSGTDGGQFTNVTSPNYAYWGARNVGASPSLYTAGGLRDACVWNRALSAAEVWSLYDTRTRWDLYWQPSRTVHFDIPAVSTDPVAAFVTLGLGPTSYRAGRAA